DVELTRLVDDGLDAQDHAELVVHFQPVALHAVLDARAGPALFAAEGEDLAIELRTETPAEETQDVVGGEVQQSMLDHARVESLQIGAASGAHLTAELGLIHDPIVGTALQPLLLEQRIDLARPAV